MTANRIIAIDGPAAAGKGTLARRLAAHFGLPYLDTGLLYRAVGRKMLDQGVGFSNPEAAEACARALAPADLQAPNLRTPEVDRAAATVASIPGVRAALLAFQRGYGRDLGAVLDGRDIGTIIFPDASAKFFVTASVAARAHRRWLELQQRGLQTSEDAVREDMEARDAADASRAAAPLRAAPDALVLDTTSMNADEAFAACVAHLHALGWQTPPGAPV